MTKISLVGTGNLATHLYRSFVKEDAIEIVQVIGRKAAPFFKLDKFAQIGTTEIKKADVYIVAVSDSAIPAVSKLLAHSEGLVAHTSGSMALSALKNNVRSGVFYPLQTFSKAQIVDFNTIPICIEATTENDLGLLKQLASLISTHVVELNYEQRRSLHLAAVFVNNFTNHLFYIGQQICKEHNVPVELLAPLIRETTEKIEKLPPFEAQTGPARRNDLSVIENHLEQLKNKSYKEMYSLLTKSIQRTYAKKL